MSPAVGACVRSPSPALLIRAPSRCQPLPQVRVSPPCSLSDKIWQTLCYTDLKEELLMPARRWSSVWELSASRQAEAGSPINSCTPRAPCRPTLSRGLFWGDGAVGRGLAPAPQLAPSALPPAPHRQSRHPWTSSVLLLHPLPLLVPSIPAGFGMRIGKRREKSPEFCLLDPVTHQALSEPPQGILVISVPMLPIEAGSKQIKQRALKMHIYKTETGQKYSS